MQAIPQTSKILCPSCGGGHILKVHFRGTIARRVFRIINLQPNRCSGCGMPFYGHLGRVALASGAMSCDTPH
jgi:hypothetical protein